MAYNHGYEEKKFKQEWKKLEAEYKEAGMSDEQISAIYIFDREVFNSDRRYLENYDDFQFDETGESENETIAASQAKKMEKNVKVLSVEMELKTEETTLEWADLIENDSLYCKVMKLTPDEKELLRLIAIEELPVVEIAKRKEVAHQTISKKIKRIKRKMNQD